RASRNRRFESVSSSIARAASPRAKSSPAAVSALAGSADTVRRARGVASSVRLRNRSTRTGLRRHRTAPGQDRSPPTDYLESVSVDRFGWGEFERLDTLPQAWIARDILAGRTYPYL